MFTGMGAREKSELHWRWWIIRTSLLLTIDVLVLVLVQNIVRGRISGTRGRLNPTGQFSNT